METEADLEEIRKRLKQRKLPVVFGDDPGLVIKRLKFGVPQLDAILGGGMAYGRVGLIIGGFGAGKTFLCQMAIKAAQSEGLSTAFIDVEHSFDPTWFRTTGVDISKLLVSQAPLAEDALDLLVSLCEEEIDLVILDSVASMLPRAEMEEDVGKSFIALQARLLNRGLRKLVKVNKRSVVLMTNQMRSSMARFVQYALPGGVGQQFFASYILRVERGPKILEEKKLVGYHMRLKTEKNKLFKSFEQCTVPFTFGEGFTDSVSGLIQLGIDYELIGKSGIWLSYADEKFMGRRRFAVRLREDEALQEELRKSVEKMMEER